MSVLSVQHIRKVFKGGGFFGGGAEKIAVNDLSFDLVRGETLAIVGESGSGKSTTARLAMRLLDADAGQVIWAGEDVSLLTGKALREKRKHLQMVFQDPFASLNPKMKIVDTVAEGLRVHQPSLSKAERRRKVAETLQLCGLGEEALDRYPHQFSGGQRQRIGIARALIVQPEVLVLDEPVSALDVSVQAQILNLLKQLQQEKGLAYLFISHDLSVVQHIATRVMVMFAGFVVEEGDVDTVFNHPKHPYTKSLLDAKPISHPSQRSDEDVIAVDEGVASVGCAFAPRCAFAQDACKLFDMQLKDGVACLYPL
ncbi:ABC transporter ATP-binding protein [Ghiorsea bivora]|uniref:ABC transporter ATP-binding protein n=1 Tax=Ghiorsea bivora TaxID=1485545 RepID=UPI000570CDBC|nr:oligopeptide/dipeptide ABC transporter ATP-binding protein [Ghiorsea bivora]